jgi:hypothetical protein
MSVQELDGINRRAKPAPGRTSAPAALALGCACCLLVATGSGCKTGAGARKDDPLFGLKPPTVAPVPPSDHAQSPNSPPQASWNNVPPIPTLTSADSNAALASLPGARPLRINETPPPKSTGPTVQPIPRDVPTNPGLLTTGGWQQAPATPASTTNASANPIVNQTPEQALALLKQRGVLSHKVDVVPEGVRLTAVVPDRTRPGQFLTREVRAASVQAAVQALLKQLQ